MVRVIRAFIMVNGVTKEYRLITNLLDATEAPAKELLARYAKRWPIETAFAEFKQQWPAKPTR